jgi:FdhD protein
MKDERGTMNGLRVHRSSFIVHRSTMDATKSIDIRTSSNEQKRDAVAVEEPLEIRVFEKPVAVTMRTPGEDEDLATGFLLTEGIIRSAGEIESIRPWGSPNIIRVALADDVTIDYGRLQRHFYATSSCGICGKSSIDALRVFTTPIESTVRVGGLDAMAAALRRRQTSFDATGAIHGAGAFRANGELLCVREDIGRHNAVDKIAGALLRSGQTADVIVISGRASFEVVQKCIVARIPVVAAVGAPSSLAVDLAREYDITLVGFLRDGRYNVYSDTSRLS